MCRVRNKHARRFGISFLVFFHLRCVLIPDAIELAAPLAGHTRTPFSIESVCNFELRSGIDWAFDRNEAALLQLLHAGAVGL